MSCTNYIDRFAIAYSTSANRAPHAMTIIPYLSHQRHTFSFHILYFHVVKRFYILVFKVSNPSRKCRVRFINAFTGKLKRGRQYTQVHSTTLYSRGRQVRYIRDFGRPNFILVQIISPKRGQPSIANSPNKDCSLKYPLSSLRRGIGVVFLMPRILNSCKGWIRAAVIWDFYIPLNSIFKVGDLPFRREGVKVVKVVKLKLFFGIKGCSRVDCIPNESYIKYLQCKSIIHPFEGH